MIIRSSKEDIAGLIWIMIPALQYQLDILAKSKVSALHLSKSVQLFKTLVWKNGRRVLRTCVISSFAGKRAVFYFCRNYHDITDMGNLLKSILEWPLGGAVNQCVEQYNYQMLSWSEKISICDVHIWDSRDCIRKLKKRPNWPTVNISRDNHDLKKKFVYTILIVYLQILPRCNVYLQFSLDLD